MRQAGIVAAAMDHALDHHIERLADDHAHAQLLHDGLAELATQHADLQVEPAQTNMVYVNFANLEAAQKVSDYLRENGVLTARSQRMRLVTHLNISRSDCRASTNVIQASPSSRVTAVKGGRGLGS